MIDAAAHAVGRDPRDVRRGYDVIGAIGAFGRGNGLVGPVALWVDTLTDWAIELGFDTFLFCPATDAPGQLALFASEVIPAVRERVAARRARS